MFEKARLKLTAQYVAIIMLVSFSFSAYIFKGVSSDFQKRLAVIEKRLTKEQLPRGWKMQGPVHEFFVKDFDDAKAAFVIMLIYANGMIFILSFAAGYYLAGKTLDPIESAMNKQKRFIADAGHELKTPLTALHTSIEVALRDKKLNLKEARKILKDSLSDVGDLNKLANDLIRLNLYQIGDNFLKEKIDMNKMVASVKKKMSNLAKKRGVRVKYKVNGTSLMANRDSLEKLLIILLDNAIKYTPKGGKVTLSVKKRSRSLVITVEDTGVGIAKRDRRRIFERFFRVDPSRSKIKTDGYGLGLSMAKEIVKLHKGTIRTKSKLGKGSTFTVRLPLS
jgi:signal transduction histidine kinase